MKDLNIGEYNQDLSCEKIMNNYDKLNYSISTINVEKDENKNPLTTKFLDFDRAPILQNIKEYQLSKNVLDIANDYEKQFSERNKFLWKFMGAVFENTGATLSTVDPKCKNNTTDIKIVFTILCAIFDDVADIYNDKDLIIKLKNIVLNQDNKLTDNDEKVILVKKMWNYLQDEMKKLPRYEEFINILMYDLKQMFNGFDYSCLLKEQPYLSNIIETENYDCHNMMVFIFNGIDLMASPGFKFEDLPHMRTAFWHAQKMARIGNWLSTWKREIDEKDFGSGVFTYLFSKKIININEINNLTKDEIISIIEKSDVYNHFAIEWFKNHEKLKSLKKYIKSIDMNIYIKGLEDVIQYHLATEGFK